MYLNIHMIYHISIIIQTSPKISNGNIRKIIAFLDGLHMVQVDLFILPNIIFLVSKNKNFLKIQTATPYTQLTGSPEEKMYKKLWV